MVKADAYNHGMLVAKYIEDMVDSFGVSSCSEGVFLRNIGIEKPIKVVAFVANEMQEAIAFDLIPVIGDRESLFLFALKNEKINVDLKLDSGMNRIGFNAYNDIHRVIELLKDNKNIHLNSLATHFSFSDYKRMHNQAERFKHLCAFFEKVFGYIPKNASASSGLIYDDEFLFDEVRVGLILYGYMPDNSLHKLNLRKAMSITVPIVAVKKVKEGEKVGYGGLYTAPKDVKIGIVRGGYFDGINRFATEFKVYVNGKMTKLVGSICMDLSFVFLDDIDAKVGDEVIILGEENDAYELAEHCNTIPYEIMTSFKGRIKRIYYI